ncbi:unnamed protein product [Rotaria magnacalcarata]|uniref:Uncharacterized protein n=3 Tax=Rotaria magnacalcarata TaxID=392030 RepID=A0A814NVS6_9BILA|nr:unnamed protein product [Rotaria magnacalcarata]CAF4440483.1 unnamed protein product [Rotaria magnacalcarata]CAF5066471.1 unnamed protein product [Rotaria magnacalcarata]CAF5154991.1 unnamed protein product [Rotaria magnacalcarata]
MGWPDQTRTNFKISDWPGGRPDGLPGACQEPGQAGSSEWNYGWPSLRLSEAIIIIVGLTQFIRKGELLQLNRYTPAKTELNNDY